nr:AraC family transcriptional regulator [Propionicimonas sp.]
MNEFGRVRVAAGDVVMLAPETLSGMEPRRAVTTTTLFLDRDYAVDQVFWELAALVSDRRDAPRVVDAFYVEPVQIVHLGPDGGDHLAPWLDELVDLSLRGATSARYYRIQARLFSVVDVIWPHIQLTTARVTATQRRAARQTLPRLREFRPLRNEARQAAEQLRRTPERRWTLAELARSVHLSPSQLGRVFVDAYGKTPFAYLTMIRVERLATLLRATSHPVGVVARQVGWDDPSYAARQFRRCLGVTPRQYRASDGRSAAVA